MIISFKTQWQFIQYTSKFFSYFLLGKRNDWFDTANNKLDQKVNLTYFGRKLYNKQRLLGITQSSLPRKRKRPAKLLDENKVPLYDEVSDVEAFYRCIYFDAIDTATNCIKSNSHSQDTELKRHWATYFKCYKWIRVSKPARECSFWLWWRNKSYSLSIQLQILKTKFIDSNEKTVCAKINYMKNNIVSQNIFLLKLYPVSSATNAVSEWSASSMCRIKNWLRSTMSQERLNRFMLRSITKKNLMK